MREYAQATRAYSQAVAAFTRAVGIAIFSEYGPLKQKALEAREAAEDCRRRLQEHVVQHRC